MPKREADDLGMYSLPDGQPDLDHTRHLCAFCRTPIRSPWRHFDGTLHPYCDDWCEAQDTEWFRSILRTGYSKNDPTAGRQWLTAGGEGI